MTRFRGSTAKDEQNARTKNRLAPSVFLGRQRDALPASCRPTPHGVVRASP